MAWFVAIVDAPSARAGFARVGGLDIKFRGASQSCFIGDKLAELAERPVVRPSSLPMAGLEPAGLVTMFKRLAKHFLLLRLWLQLELGKQLHGLCSTTAVTATGGRAFCPT